jgi:hypothetical protein
MLLVLSHNEKWTRILSISNEKWIAFILWLRFKFSASNGVHDSVLFIFKKIRAN